jgi:hypothetical protein
MSIDDEEIYSLYANQMDHNLSYDMYAGSSGSPIANKSLTSSSRPVLSAAICHSELKVDEYARDTEYIYMNGHMCTSYPLGVRS